MQRSLSRSPNFIKFVLGICDFLKWKFLILLRRATFRGDLGHILGSSVLGCGGGGARACISVGVVFNMCVSEGNGQLLK